MGLKDSMLFRRYDFISKVKSHVSCISIPYLFFRH
jgi:hypothetical protein